MRGHHSPLHVFSLVATSALAFGLRAIAALAATKAATTERNPASLATAGSSSASQTEPRRLVDEPRTAADSDSTSGSLRRVTTTPTTPGELLSPRGASPASGAAPPGQQHVPVTTPGAGTTPARSAASTEPSVTGPPSAACVATLPGPPNPVATEPVATARVATRPVNSQSAPLCPSGQCSANRLINPLLTGRSPGL
jgi:hypothetical protein